MNEFDEYLKSLGEVKPLEKSDRQPVNNKKSLNQNVVTARQVNAQSSWNSNDPFLVIGEVPVISPDDPIEYKKSGVQNGVYKNLRLGKYEIQSVLNLKGQSLDKARRALFDFIKQSIKHNNRCLLIQHGNGIKSTPPKATLKSYINNWLPQFDEVMAFHSALRMHGGNGSTYVLLKKNDDARLDNKERFQKRHHQ